MASSSTTKLVFSIVLVFISLLLKGNCQCTTKDIKIEQSATGALVGNKTEWSVTVNNDCSCTQLDIELDCKGFQTVEPVDPSVLRYSSDSGQCLVNGGQPIFPFQNLTFNYAWDSSFSFDPVSSQMACS